MNRPIITLITDWGQKDFFVAKAKAKILSSLPDATIVDISHDIPLNDVGSASFVAKNSCPDFPPGTIHIIDVSQYVAPGNSVERIIPLVIVAYKEQYFIMENNGINTDIFQSQPDAVVKVDYCFDSMITSFRGLNLMIPMAVKIAQGASLRDFGETSVLKPVNKFQSFLDENSRRLTCYVAYSDAHGNAYLDLTYEEFLKILNGSGFSLNIGRTPVKKITNNFDEIPDNDLGLMVSSTGCLMIVIRNHSLKQYCNIEQGSAVQFCFE